VKIIASVGSSTWIAGSGRGPGQHESLQHHHQPHGTGNGMQAVIQPDGQREVAEEGGENEQALDDHQRRKPCK
jgi:hypothetical protein